MIMLNKIINNSLLLTTIAIVILTFASLLLLYFYNETFDTLQPFADLKFQYDTIQPNWLHRSVLDGNKQAYELMVDQSTNCVYGGKDISSTFAYSLLMANKYDDSLACYYVYLGIITLCKESPIQSDSISDSLNIELAKTYLKKSADLGYDKAIYELNNLNFYDK